MNLFAHAMCSSDVHRGFMAFMLTLLVQLQPRPLAAQGPPVDTDILKSDTAIILVIYDADAATADSFIEHLALTKVRKMPIFPIRVTSAYAAGRSLDDNKGQTSADISSAQADTSVLKLLFCGGVEDDLPVGVSNWFFFGNAREYLYAFYNPAKALNTEQIKMVIVDKHGLNNEKTQWFQVKPKWKYTFLKCTFPGEGDYQVVLYNEAGVKLAEGFITILTR
ncbi:MAG: hypothetical protein KatS3mg031_2182 [Chitinophagales bacterium]|nr:MAG: hypothetical protein KatS3mg031_2182 [Chitinophagales bacterium]